MMKWTELTDLDSVERILERSFKKRQAIFKHSTRCIISKTVKRNFEAEISVDSDQVDIHHLDLIAHRDVSAKVAELTGVVHQSPQLIILEHGEVVHHSSHQAISAQAISM